MFPKYEIIFFWSQEDNSFIAEVPELPGCMADGLTYAEALKNIELVITDIPLLPELLEQTLLSEIPWVLSLL